MVRPMRYSDLLEYTPTKKEFLAAVEEDLIINHGFSEEKARASVNEFAELTRQGKTRLAQRMKWADQLIDEELAKQNAST